MSSEEAATPIETPTSVPGAFHGARRRSNDPQFGPASSRKVLNAPMRIGLSKFRGCSPRRLRRKDYLDAAIRAFRNDSS